MNVNELVETVKALSANHKALLGRDEDTPTSNETFAANRKAPDMQHDPALANHCDRDPGQGRAQSITEGRTIWKLE